MVFRLAIVLLTALATTAFDPCRGMAQWVDGGVPVSIVPGGKFGVMVAPDGLGGAFLAWTAIRPEEPENSNIFAQHVRSDGSIDPRWPENGLPVCTAAGWQYAGAIAPDGTGGAFIAWSDYRSPPPDSARVYAVYLQRIAADGALATGWPENGFSVCPGGCTEQTPKLAPDGAGGVFVAWPRDTLILPGYSGPGGFRSSRVTGDGVLAPGWPTEGITIAPSATRQRLNSVLPDGAGGLYTVNDHDLEQHTYCHRVAPDGATAPGWPGDGLEVSPTPSFGATAVPDGHGGLFFFWSSFTATGDPYAGIYAVRLDPDGSPAAGWPAAGLRVGSTGANEPLTSVATSDGGAIVLWFHFDLGIVSAHAQKVTPTGSAAEWPDGGLLVVQGDRYIQGLVGASDGLGGAYFAWEFYESAPLGVPPPTGVIAQHLRSDGVRAPGWPSGGLGLSSSAAQGNEPAMIPVSGNAAVVAWEGYFGGPGNKILAQKLIEGGVESFSLLLTRFDATPNRVHLQWRALPSADVSVTVYRREEGESWQVQGVVHPDFSGLLTFEDLNVVSGRDYSYRVSVRTGGDEHFYGETNVRVPAFALAVRLASPNPVRGELTAEVELPGTGTAWIELIDVQGRIVERKQVGGSGPAIFRTPIANGGHLTSGVYFLRLTQGGKAVTRRAVLVH